MSGNSGPGSDGGENQISGNRIPARAVTPAHAEEAYPAAVFQKMIFQEIPLSGSTSGNSISANSISQNSTGGNKEFKRKTPPGSEGRQRRIGRQFLRQHSFRQQYVEATPFPGSSASGNSVSDSDIIAHMGRNTAKLEDPFDRKHYTLAQRQEVRSSIRKRFRQ